MVYVKEKTSNYNWYAYWCIGIWRHTCICSNRSSTSDAEHKIVVNGVEYTDTEYPILNYNGTTYVPLRAVGKLLGNEPRWNEEKRQVELGETIDIDLSQWIGITDAAKIHSIKIYLGKELILEKGGKKYTVPAPKTNKSEIQTLKDVSSDVTLSL